MPSPSYTNTAIWLLRRITGSSDIKDIDAGIAALADDIDTKLTPWSHGPLSSLPTSTTGSPGIAGRRYYADDAGLELVDLGTSWSATTIPGELRSVAFAVTAGGEPAGWLLADGRSLLRTAQPGLFHQIGTTFGAVDGTHFDLPDLRGRMLLGESGSHTVGGVGGEETHLLLATESGLPVHDTGAQSANHHHAAPDGEFLEWDASDSFNHTPGTDTSRATAASALTGPEDNFHTHHVNAANAANAHNNMPPFAVVSHLIKT